MKDPAGEGEPLVGQQIFIEHLHILGTGLRIQQRTKQRRTLLLWLYILEEMTGNKRKHR